MTKASEQKHNCMEHPLSMRVEILRLLKQQKFNHHKSLGKTLTSFLQTIR